MEGTGFVPRWGNSASCPRHSFTAFYTQRWPSCVFTRSFQWRDCTTIHIVDEEHLQFNYLLSHVLSKKITWFEAVTSPLTTSSLSLSRPTKSPSLFVIAPSILHSSNSFTFFKTSPLNTRGLLNQHQPSKSSLNQYSPCSTNCSISSLSSLLQWPKRRSALPFTKILGNMARAVELSASLSSSSTFLSSVRRPFAHSS